MFKRTFPTACLVVSLIALTGCSDNDSPPQDLPGTNMNQVSPGYTDVLTAGENVRLEDGEVTPQNGIVLVPFGSLEVAKVGTSDTLDSDAESPIIPSKGETFYVAYLDVQYGNPNQTPEVSVDVNGQTMPVELQQFTDQTLVVSAPDNSEITLHVNFEGVDQTVDLLTGERTSEDIPALYSGSGSFAADGVTTTYKTTGVYGDVTLEGEIDEVTRIPWDANLGWADNGESAWLVFDAPITWKYESATRGVSAENIDANWVVTDPQGTEYIVTAEKDKLPVIKAPASALQLDAFVRGSGQTYDGNQPEAVVTGQTSPVEVFF